MDNLGGLLLLFTSRICWLLCRYLDRLKSLRVDKLDDVRLDEALGAGGFDVTKNMHASVQVSSCKMRYVIRCFF